MTRLIELLTRNSVQVVVDVRSHPYSKYASQFDYEHLMQALRGAGFQYVYLGAELGGRPRQESYYDARGRVLYDKVAETTTFQQGLARLESGIRQYTVATLCAEEDPTECHRRLLVGQVLKDRGIAVEHIRGDGRIQTEDELSSDQLSLFGDIAAWKSIPSVSLKRRQSSSSAF